MTFDAFAYFYRMHLNDITIFSKRSTANDSIKVNLNIEFRQIVSVHVEAEHERKIARKWHFLNWTCLQYSFSWLRQFNVWTQSHLGNSNWRWKLWRKRANHERKCLKVKSYSRLVDGFRGESRIDLRIFFFFAELLAKVRNNDFVDDRGVMVNEQNWNQFSCLQRENCISTFVFSFFSVTRIVSWKCSIWWKERWANFMSPIDTPIIWFRPSYSRRQSKHLDIAKMRVIEFVYFLLFVADWHSIRLIWLCRFCSKRNGGELRGSLQNVEMLQSGQSGFLVQLINACLAIAKYWFLIFYCLIIEFFSKLSCRVIPMVNCTYQNDS